MGAFQVHFSYSLPPKQGLPLETSLADDNEPMGWGSSLQVVASTACG